MGDYGTRKIFISFSDAMRAGFGFALGVLAASALIGIVVAIVAGFISAATTSGVGLGVGLALGLSVTSGLIGIIVATALVVRAVRTPGE